MCQRILVFAPHPDDDILGCGGSIAKHVQAGNTVLVAYFTSGEAGSLAMSGPELAACREQEARQALAGLGVEEAFFCGFPDGYLGYTPETLEAAVSLIRQYQPHWVYVTHGQEEHTDHQQAFAIVLEACKRAKGPWFPQCGSPTWEVEILLGYEVWTPIQGVSYTEDISDFMEAKLQALQAHKSQLQQIPYAEAVKGLNCFRGIMTGQGAYCECFQVVRINSSLITGTQVRKSESD